MEMHNVDDEDSDYEIDRSPNGSKSPLMLKLWDLKTPVQWVQWRPSSHQMIPGNSVWWSVRPSRSNLSPSFDFHSEAFGHWIKKKKDCFRIVAGNLGGFPAKATDKKNKAL
jgi:hypothetical protein